MELKENCVTNSILFRLCLYVVDDINDTVYVVFVKTRLAFSNALSPVTHLYQIYSRTFVILVANSKYIRAISLYEIVKIYLVNSQVSKQKLEYCSIRADGSKL